MPPQHEIDVLITQDFFFRLIREKNKTEILNIILNKQTDELHNLKTIQTKKNDLIIWNALLFKEVVKSGQTQQALLPIYSTFVEKINFALNLNHLFELELTLFNAYLDIMIHDTETTNHLLVNKILQYLYINIENYQTIQEICSAVNISTSHASKIFKEHTGTSIMKYSKKLKIERAKTLLLDTDENLLTISERLGFYDQGHFSRTFKEFVGISPIQFRNHPMVSNETK